MTQSRMIMLWGVWLSLIIVAPVAALVPPIPLAATTWTLALTSSSSSSFSLLPLATTTAMWIADNKNDMELAELPPPYVVRRKTLLVCVRARVRSIHDSCVSPPRLTCTFFGVSFRQAGAFWCSPIGGSRRLDGKFGQRHGRGGLSWHAIRCKGQEGN